MNKTGVMMNKEKLCGCGKKATYLTTIKRIYCDDCGVKLTEQETEFEKYQKEQRETQKTENKMGK